MILIIYMKFKEKFKILLTFKIEKLGFIELSKFV